MIKLFRDLEDYYTQSDDVFVICNMLLFYERGNPKAFKSPDVMVVKGVPKVGPRRSFKIWLENAVPNVIFEMTSEKTQQEDIGDKRDLYGRIGVAEYYLFDPLADYLEPRFQGFHLVGDEYLPMQADREGGIASAELDLRLVPDGYYLSLFELGTDRRILSVQEVELEREKQRAQDAIRIAALEKRRSKEEKKRSKEVKLRAEREKSRADSAEAEFKRLQELVARLQGKNE